MRVPTFRFRLPLLLSAFSVALLGWHTNTSPAAVILMHGREDEATFRDDGALLTHLQDLYGASNVTYMRGLNAAADGSSAIGYDAVVISSSLASNDIRNKYEDSRVGILNMENAITQRGLGNFNMSETAGTTPLVDQTQITIVNPTHPLAAGLNGTVTVFTSPQFMQVGRGALAGGATLIASGQTPTDHTIFAVDAGGALLGDGTEGNPNIAAGRRVHFFVSDPGFASLTGDGKALFNAALAWVVPEPAGSVLCALGLSALLGRRAGRRS
jgi:hypothetical protein